MYCRGQTAPKGKATRPSSSSRAGDSGGSQDVRQQGMRSSASSDKLTAGSAPADDGTSHSPPQSTVHTQWPPAAVALGTSLTPSLPSITGWETVSTKKSSVKPLPSALARSGSSTSAAAPAAPRRALASQGSFAALAQMEEDKKAEKKKKKEKKVHPPTERKTGSLGLGAEWASDSLSLVVFVRRQEKADKEKKEKKVSTQIQKSISLVFRLSLHPLAALLNL